MILVQMKAFSLPYIYTYIYVRGLHGPGFFRPGPARPGPHGYNLGTARPEVKKIVLAWAWPSPKEELKFRSEHGPVRKGNWNFGPSLAWHETKYKILARARPDQFFFRFRPRQLGLSDFKTSSVTCI